MAKFVCAQRGCTFDSNGSPEVCPVCKNPFIDRDHVDAGNVEAPWSDYTIKELREYCESWELEGWNSRTGKDDLIKLLEAAEAE